MPDCIRVVVIDDHSLFRSGVVQSLELDDRIRVVGEGSTGSDAIALAQAHAPDLILLDISMRDNGIEAAAQIRKLTDKPKIVMLTVSESDEDIVRALEAGAAGYVLKGIEARQLIEVVKSVAEGSSFVSPNLAHRLVSILQGKARASPFSTLTQQEEKTLRLVTEGKSNRQIGVELGILEKTVKAHMTQIMRKLRVKNRLEAALMARDRWPHGRDARTGSPELRASPDVT